MTTDTQTPAPTEPDGDGGGPIAVALKFRASCPNKFTAIGQALHDELIACARLVKPYEDAHEALRARLERAEEEVQRLRAGIGALAVEYGRDKDEYSKWPSDRGTEENMCLEFHNRLQSLLAPPAADGQAATEEEGGGRA